MAAGTNVAVNERTIHGSGLELFVTERGDPVHQTVVCIHGFPDTSAVWAPFAESLASDFHVVTYDVRGAGRSEVPAHRADYALPVLVEDIEAVLNATSPDRPVHLVAHDWGSIQGWEAVTTERLRGRFASYTSISGPPIDHAGLWALRRRTRKLADLRQALWQAVHSWYIVFFHLPFLPELAARNARAQRLWGKALHRMEGAPVDATWPAPTFGQDFAHGVELYRANIRTRMAHPTLGHATCPVQLIIPLKDRYVTPALLEGLEDWASLMWRRPVDAGHWVVRTNAAELGRWVREVISYVEEGTESSDLQRGRVA
ncbi:MAG TPA: alpha/beta fold hydrolase [Acidimicrobiales bacterium]|jgi:pimeloyl-ACP methyl ester carboxylesterase